MAPAEHRRKAARTSPRQRSGKTPPRKPPKAAAPLRRARLAFLGSIVLSVVVLFAWFPVGSLLHQRATLSDTESQLATLHQQDAALAQETKNLSDSGEIGRIARQQYQLVSPGQQAYEVLPPSGAATPGTPYAGDPGSKVPVAPSATPELPPGGVTTTTTPPTSASAAHTSAAGSDAGGAGFVGRVLHALEFWR